MRILPFEPQHLNGVVQLSLRAWAPVFDSLRNVFGPDLYQTFYPEEWRAAQQKAVEDACKDEAMHVWVAVGDGADASSGPAVAGFVAVRFHAADNMGEIYMIAVDPEAQTQGIGSRLTTHAIDWMKSKGMSVAMVETGGDPGHAPARALYEKSGFRLFPVSRYFMKL